MTLKAPRPKRSHTRRAPKRAKPYDARRGKWVPKWTPTNRNNMAKLDADKRSFWPQAED